MKAPFIAHSELTGRYYLVASLWPDGSARKKADITDCFEELLRQRTQEQTNCVLMLEAENAALRDALQAWHEADVHTCETCAQELEPVICVERRRLWDIANALRVAALDSNAGADILERLESIRELCEDKTLRYDDLADCCAELTHWERPYVVPGDKEEVHT